MGRYCGGSSCASAPLSSTNMCCGNPNNSAVVKKANCLAVATLIFGLASLIGIIFYPFVGGVGGILTVIGTSIVICCQGDKPNGHMACAVLCILGGLCHAAGAGWLWYVYSATQQVANLFEASEGREVADAVATWARSDLLKNPPNTVEMIH